MLRKQAAESSREGYGAESQSYSEDIFEERDGQVPAAQGTGGTASCRISTKGSNYGSGDAAGRTQIKIAC